MEEKNQLLELREKISKLSEKESQLRDLYLKQLSNSEIQGPVTGYASLDKPWLKYYNDEIILEDLPKYSIYEYLKIKNANNLDKDAIEYYGNKLTYRELIDKIDEVANALVAYGVKENDIVTICMPTTPEMVYLFYALSKIGAISNMIDPRKSSKEIEEYTSETKSKLFIGIDVASEKYRDLKRNCDVENIIVLTPYESFNKPLKSIMKFKDKAVARTKRYMDTSECIKWDEFIKKSSTIDSVKNVNYSFNKPVTIVHTGGTTGKSKGVVLSNDNINCGAHQCEVSGLDFKDKGTWLDIMPPFIAYGVGNGLHLPLSMGMKVILIPKFDPKKYDDILLKHKPNYMAGVPSHYGYLLDSEKMKNADLSFIKTPIVGGDKMDYTLEKKVNAFLKEHNCGSKIIKGYGMSEVNAAVSVCINNEVNKLKSVGIPLVKCNMGIYDIETGEELSYCQDGELRISGPNVMYGYYENEEEEKKVLHKDYDERIIYSGDLAQIDTDGNLFVKGRYKEMIIRPDGFKVYPSSIEEKILMHPAVSECKVVGCRDYSESQGELPYAFIILKNEYLSDSENIIEEIKKICTEELAEYSLPEIYEIVIQFPVTSIGKIDSIALKEYGNQKKLAKNKIK